MTEYQQDLTDRCTASHPNHEHHGSFGGKPYFWNAWCSICEAKGFLKPSDCAGEPNPEMDPVYLAEAQQKAREKQIVDDAKAAERRAKRKAKETAKGKRPVMDRQTAMEIVAALLCDLTGRRGLRQEWGKMDADFQHQIIEDWTAIVEAEGLDYPKLVLS